MKQKKGLSLAFSLMLAFALAAPASAYDSVREGYGQTLSGGGGESFLIDGGGNLWAWGSNEWGQLGTDEAVDSVWAGEDDPWVPLEDGGLEDHLTPVKILENVRSVSAGEDHVYAVLEDNTLWAWGRNVSNAFPGRDELLLTSTPIKIMDDVLTASTGTLTHLAVKTDNTLWAWGRYVGDRTNKQRSEPVKIMDNVSAASTGFGHSLALKMNGDLYAWGQNNDGEVGDGSGRERPTPVKVLDRVVSMSAGYGFSAAVKSDGTLWTWGRNWQGELGDGTTWTWGPNWDWHSPDPEEEELLQATLEAWIEKWGPQANRDHSVPTQVLNRAVGVYAANNNCYALRSDGTLWAWGSNVCGAVGDGTTTDRLSPVQVLEGVEDVGVGWDHVLAKKTDGTLWTWGANLCGQLGNGESGFADPETYALRFSSSPILIAEGVDSTWPNFDPQPHAGDAPAPWAQEAVDQAIAQGFLPFPLRSRYGQPITRAEFCALAVQFYEAATGVEIEGRFTFTDTRDKNVEKAAFLGIVSGTGGHLFSPDAFLTREQAAVILTNLARELKHPLPPARHTFSDEDISPWAQDAVGQVQQAEVMSGMGGSTFAPQSTYTREQSVATIMNLYRLMA